MASLGQGVWLSTRVHGQPWKHTSGGLGPAPTSGAPAPLLGPKGNRTASRSGSYPLEAKPRETRYLPRPLRQAVGLGYPCTGAAGSFSGAAHGFRFSPNWDFVAEQARVLGLGLGAGARGPLHRTCSRRTGRHCVGSEQTAMSACFWAQAPETQNSQVLSGFGNNRGFPHL